ncbi:MAG: hypothetical protein WBP55_06985 [Solirubrobacterales bacterium]
MNPDQIKRTDFPSAEHGYDRASVDAHLAAVAAQMTALEARINSFEVERDAMRRQVPAAAGPTGAEVPSKAAVPGQEDSTATSISPVTPPSSPPAAPKAREAGSGADEEVSARLIATKMALENVDRESIRKRLEDSYELEDVDALLADVLERVS